DSAEADERRYEPAGARGGHLPATERLRQPPRRRRQRVVERRLVRLVAVRILGIARGGQVQHRQPAFLGERSDVLGVRAFIWLLAEGHRQVVRPGQEQVRCEQEGQGRSHRTSSTTTPRPVCAPSDWEEKTGT